MSVLKAQSKKEMSKFVGVFLPPRIQQSLTLYTLAKGVTKSDVIRDQLEKWATEQTESDKVLIELIASKIQGAWLNQKESTPFSTFKKTTERELESKGVPAAYILDILNLMK